MTFFKNRMLLAAVFFVLLPASAGSAPAEKPPHYEAVMEILRPLEYSGLPFLANKDSALSVDFKNRTWRLRNARKYGPKGELQLDQGRYGLCTDLAYYTFQHIKPLFEDDYVIQFARVTESDFFTTPESNHVVLALFNKATKDAYLLDPSFHLYGQKFRFKQYTFFMTKDTMESFDKKETDLLFAVDDLMPILIRKNHLISFSVESVNGKFDRQNFILSILVRKKRAPAGAYLLAVKNENGALTIYKNEKASAPFLAPEEEMLLGDKLLEWTKTLNAS